MKQKTSYKRNYCLNLPEVLIALRKLSRLTENPANYRKTLEEVKKHIGICATTRSNNNIIT